MQLAGARPVNRATGGGGSFPAAGPTRAGGRAICAAIALASVFCGASAAHAATPREAATAPCTKTITTRDDPSAAIAALSPGESLCLREGRYGAAITIGPAVRGTAGAPITVRAYPGESVIIKPGAGKKYALGISAGSGARAGYDTDPTSACYTGRCSPTVPQWLRFRDLVFDGAGLSARDSKVVFLMGTGVSACEDRDRAVGPHHITFERVEVRNGPDQGVYGAGDYVTLIDCDVHDNGFGNSAHATHGLYIEGKHWTVRGGSIWRNRCEGVHVWTGEDCGDASDNTFEDLTVHSNGFWGIGIACGARNKVLNSDIHGHARGRRNYPGAGIGVHGGAWGTTISGNAIFDNAGAAVRIGEDVWWNGKGCAGTYEPLDPDLHGAARGASVWHTTVRDNLVHGNGPGNDSTGQILEGAHARRTTLSGNAAARRPASAGARPPRASPGP